MFRKVKTALFITWMSALAGPAFAIGLGEIQLHTPLNEPLHAEIQLLQVKDFDENDLLVGLAPKADFEAAGVDRLFFLTSLKFALDLDNPRGPMVVVTTDAPVREPYLNFLLEVQWPNGRLLREYTLLMDLPTFTETQAVPRPIKGTQTAQVPAVTESAPLDVAALEAELAAVEQQGEAVVAPAPVASAPQAAETVISEQEVSAQEASPAAAEQPAYEPQAEPAPAPAPEEAPVAEAPPAPAPAPVADYQPAVPVYATTPEDHTVQQGDNLWSIAVSYRQRSSECTSREYRCEDGITIQQAMLAMQRLNPDAFINGNINQLKKGRVLRMPSQDDVTDMTSREAVAEVMRQNIAWSGDPNGRRGAVAVAGEQLDATTAQAEAPEAPEALEEGRLKLTVPGKSDGSQAGKGAGADSGKVEALQNELVIAMEELDRLKREKRSAGDEIVSLGDQVKTLEKMLQVRSAELQALQAAAAKAAEQAAAAPAATEEAPVTEAPAVTTSAEAPAPEAAPATEKAAAEEKPAAEAPATEESGFNLVYIAGAVGGLLLIVLVVVVLRKRAANKANIIEGDEPLTNVVRTDDDFDQTDSALDDLDDVSDSLEEPEAVADEIGLDEPAPAKAETGDALGEADIYISFGSYDKAESLLKNAIAAEPARTDLRLKLLEVYVGMDNLSAFDKQYDALAAQGDFGAMEQAQEMRNRIPAAADVPLKGSAAPLAAAPAAAAKGDDLDFDLDLSLDDTDLGSTSADTGGKGDSDFDLDLSFDLDEAEEPTASTPKVSVSEAPTVQQRAINISDAPTVQQKAFSISEAPTAVTPAVGASSANTEIREELDLDLSEFSQELDSVASDDLAEKTRKAIANDEPTPAAALDEEFDFLADADEAATKLDLARAYIDMGDKDGAKDILQEVIEEGKEAQKEEARKLLANLR